MNQITKAILAIIVMVAVLAYTILNYVNGRTEFNMLVVSMVIIGIPLVNMINIVIQELKKK